MLGSQCQSAPSIIIRIFWYIKPNTQHCNTCAFLLTVFVLCVLLSSYVYPFILCVFVYLIYICCNLYVFVVPYMYLLYYVCIAVLTLDARLLARSQYPGGPATGHLDTGFSWFPCVYKRMLRWFPSFQIATTCFSCSPPDLNSLVTFFSYLCTCKIPTATGWQPNCS
jgi:hypothetical protein